MSVVATDATTDTGATKGGMATDEGRDGTEGRHDSDGALVSLGTASRKLLRGEGRVCVHGAGTGGAEGACL